MVRYCSIYFYDGPTALPKFCRFMMLSLILPMKGLFRDSKRVKLPFTIQQFLDVFRKYNTAFYPIQILLLALAAYIIFLSVRSQRLSGKTITIILACLWIWMGAAYHIAFFSAINKAAYVFGAVFILQGILLLFYGLIKGPSFSFHKNIYSITGALLFVYSLIVYPLIGYFSGHSFPYSPTFGLPCPTTIFTFAVFLLAKPKIPFYIAVIPLLWSVIGFSAAFSLSIYEDTGLIISGLSFAVLYFKPKRTHGDNDTL